MSWSTEKAEGGGQGSTVIAAVGEGGPRPPYYLLPLFNVPARRAVKLIARLESMRLLVSTFLGGGRGLPRVQAVHLAGLDSHTAGG